MRSFVVTALAAAIVACLALSVSAGGYGHGHRQTYSYYRPPRVGTRVFRQNYVIPGTGGAGGGYAYGGSAGGLYGAGSYGSPYGYGRAGGLVGQTIGTGISLIWWLVILAIVLFVLGSI